jgi:hypothetical protein
MIRRNSDEGRGVSKRQKMYAINGSRRNGSKGSPHHPEVRRVKVALLPLSLEWSSGGNARCAKIRLIESKSIEHPSHCPACLLQGPLRFEARSGI